MQSEEVSDQGRWYLVSRGACNRATVTVKSPLLGLQVMIGRFDYQRLWH